MSKSPRVRIGMPYTDEAFVSLVFAAVLLVPMGVVALLAEMPKMGAAALGVAVLAAVPAWLRFAHIRRTRLWLEVAGDQLRFTDAAGATVAAEADVVDLGISDRTYDVGATNRVRRRKVRIVLRVGERLGTYRFEQYPGDGKTDAFGDALDGALDRLAARVRRDVERGGVLTGDGWELSSARLVVRTPTGESVVPLAGVAAVDWIEDGVSVWAVGEAEPVLRRRALTPGATVLHRVLRDVLCGAPVVTPEADRELADGLGRVIFSKESLGGEQFRIAVTLIAFAVLLGTFALWYGIDNNGDTPGARAGLFLGPLLLVGAAAGAWNVWVKRGAVFRCHANGVVHTTWRGTHTLYFRDIGSFTYSGVRKFLNGGYTGTDVTIAFEPLDPAAGAPILYHANFRFADEELDRLRDHISRVIAAHMLARLRKGETVGWTPQLAFTPGGLAVRRSGKGEKPGAPRIVPYSQIAGHEFKDGVFFLSLAGDFGRPLTEPVSQTNFFPGYYLLLLLTGPPPTHEDAE